MLMAAFVVCRPFFLLAVAFFSSLSLNYADDPALASYTGNGQLLSTVIPKTVISSRLRLVYYVGLEGTGHHYISTVFTNMFKAHRKLQYIESCNIAMSIYFPLVLRNLKSYNDSMESMRQDLRVLAGAEKDLPKFGTIITVQSTHPVQRGACRDMHQLSFPGNHGPNKAQAHTDLRGLTEMSEEEGVDLRYLYLQRSAWDIFVSTTNHREFHKYLEGHDVVDDRPVETRLLDYFHVLLTNIAVLGSMLEEVGPEFVVCHKFSALDDSAQAKKIAEFLAPSDEVAKYLESAIVGTNIPGSGEREELLFEAAAIVVERLQKKLDIVEARYCDF